MMLLRRITQHVKNQNWFAVFLDFMIVVVGVFIGIQVANWNEERKDRALEEQYLERLFLDLNGSIEDFNVNYNWDKIRLQEQYIVLQSLRSGVLEENNKALFSSGLAWAGILNPQRRRWGTVEELFSTGNISLLRDIEMRKEISALGAWYDRNNEIVKASEARIVPIRAELIKKFEIIRFGTKGAEIAEVDFDFNELVEDKTFINSFANLQLESDTIVQFSRASMSRFQRLRNKLALLLNINIEGLPVLENIPSKPWSLENLEHNYDTEKNH